MADPASAPMYAPAQEPVMYASAPAPGPVVGTLVLIILESNLFFIELKVLF